MIGVIHFNQLMKRQAKIHLVCFEEKKRFVQFNSTFSPVSELLQNSHSFYSLKRGDMIGAIRFLMKPN